MIHAFTIDVEDSNSLFARERLGLDIPPTDRVVSNTRRILELLAEQSVRATFFILGEVAAAHPQLVRDIAVGGHELGTHGYSHTRVFRLSPDAFRREIRDAKALVEDLSGQAVCGHRAPAFSIRPDTPWAWQIIVEEGYTYDSSVFPFAGRRYGWPSSPLEPFVIRTPAGPLVEVPLSVVELDGHRLPAAGGGYLRTFPLTWNLWCMRRIARNRPVIVYLHPYEYETEPRPLVYPPMWLSRRLKIQAYDWLRRRGRRTVWSKMLHLLKEFRFGTVLEVFLDPSAKSERPMLDGSPAGDLL